MSNKIKYCSLIHYKDKFYHLLSNSDIDDIFDGSLGAKNLVIELESNRNIIYVNSQKDIAIILKSSITTLINNVYVYDVYHSGNASIYKRSFITFSFTFD
jgi:hypothetical protein